MTKVLLSTRTNSGALAFFADLDFFALSFPAANMRAEERASAVITIKFLFIYNLLFARIEPYKLIITQ